VQIAASRVPLKRKMIAEIYNGSEKIDENIENEWYKYSIGPFRTYRQAREFRERSGVLGAFVIVFVHGRKVNANDALVTPKHFKVSNARKIAVPEGVIFKVQIAASRHELTNDELVKIYGNTSQLESSFEDNWNKYMINCGNNYEKAVDLLKSVKVAGAFIAVYKNGSRVKLKDIYN
jgi:hypothetical protein